MLAMLPCSLAVCPSMTALFVRLLSFTADPLTVGFDLTALIRPATGRRATETCDGSQGGLGYRAAEGPTGKKRINREERDAMMTMIAGGRNRSGKGGERASLDRGSMRGSKAR